VNASSSPQSVLLLNEQEAMALPFSTRAFEVSTGPTARVLLRYSGLLVVYRDGSVARLESIKFSGFWGESFWQRAFSFANGGTRRVSVTLRTLVNFEFEEVRRLTAECVRRHPEVVAQYFEQNVAPEAVLKLVTQSSTCAELFDALGVPAPENALDSMT
jgi:hypothetical protein